MNNKIKIVLFVFIIGVVILIFMYKNKNDETKTKNKSQSNLAIMIKDESGEYVSSNEIPKGNYTLNENKTVCENNGRVLNYDNVSGKISFSFLGSDRCSLYFDKIIDNEKPVISNLTINGKTISAILTDNEGLYVYGFSTSNTSSPTNWEMISGKSFNLSTTLSTEGTYFLWVKDTAGNRAVSDVINLEKKGWQTILANSTVNSTTPDFSTVATTNEGVYAAEDDLGTSYYFRGAVDNNWVQFGKDSTGNDMYWRIIRINGDGSIRMIYTGTTSPTEITKVVMTGKGTYISIGEFNDNISDSGSIYVGYMYTDGEYFKSSKIKTKIDNWYKTTTLKDNSLITDDQIFCNDQSISSTKTLSDGTVNFFGARGRIVDNKTPILTCPTGSKKFTSKNSTIGNKKLDYAVGLITADEVAMAGGVYEIKNSSYYLYINHTYWLGSPYSFVNNDKELDSNNMFSASAQGKVDGHYVNDTTYGIRPVISLSPSVKLSGNGTWNNVYKVVN